jgi:hypothetical protein
MGLAAGQQLAAHGRAGTVQHRTCLRHGCPVVQKAAVRSAWADCARLSGGEPRFSGASCASSHMGQQPVAHAQAAGLAV